MKNALKIATVLSGGSVPWYMAGGAPTPLAVWQAKGAASLAASLVNLVSPGTHDLTVGASTTLQAAGWLADGGAYLVSDIVPALTYTIIVMVSGQNDAARNFCGCYTSATQQFSIRHAGTAQAHFVNGNTGVYVANGFRENGVFAMAAKTAFIDGVQQTSVAAGGTDPTHALFLLGLNVTGTPSARMTQGNMQAAAVWNSTLTPAQAIAVSVAMAAL